MLRTIGEVTREERSLRDKTKNQQGRSTLRETGREEISTEGVTIEEIGIMIGVTKGMRDPDQKTEGMLITKRIEIEGIPMGGGEREFPERIPKNVTKKGMRRSVRKTKRTSKRLKRSNVIPKSRSLTRINLPQSLQIGMISFKPQIKRRKKILDRFLIKSKKLSLKPQLLQNKSIILQTRED